MELAFTWIVGLGNTVTVAVLLTPSRVAWTVVWPTFRARTRPLITY